MCVRMHVVCIYVGTIVDNILQIMETKKQRISPNRPEKLGIPQMRYLQPYYSFREIFSKNS